MKSKVELNVNVPTQNLLKVIAKAGFKFADVIDEGNDNLVLLDYLQQELYYTSKSIV